MNHRPLVNLLPIVAVMLFAAGYSIVAMLTLEPVPRRVPLVTGLVTLLLLGVEVGKQFKATAVQQETVDVPRELIAILSVAGLVAGIWLLGLLLTIAVYLLLSITCQGRQSARVAVPVAGLTTLGIYLVFEVMLDSPLFPGLLFD